MFEADLKLTRKFCGIIHAFRFVADFCGRFHALGLCLWQI